MREAAAEGSARADRMMRDMPHDTGQELSERTVDERTLEGGMAHAGPDHELAVGCRHASQRFDAVDVDEMRRACQPERHRRHEALPARKHAAIVRRDPRERGDGLIDRLWRVVAELRGFHRLLVAWIERSEIRVRLVNWDAVPDFADARSGLQPPVVRFHNWDYEFFWNWGTVFPMCKVSLSRTVGRPGSAR